MPYNTRFPIATLISMVLIILTIYNPSVAETVASALFTYIWPFFFVAGLAAIALLVYKISTFKHIEQEEEFSKPYLHYSRRLQQAEERI